MRLRPVTTLLFLCLAFSGALLVAQSGTRAAQTNDAGQELYEKKIRPLLSEQCYACHGPDKQLSGLRLDRADMIRKGGNRGPLIAAGDPQKSVLLKAVSYADIQLRMPPKGKLKDDEIAALAEWVKLGMPIPTKGARGKAQGGTGKAQASSWGERLKHWAYQPLWQPAAPVAGFGRKTGTSWGRNPVDAFLLAEMAKKGLRPAPPADRRTLIRRLTFDLTGLPPSPSEVDAFIADKRPDAYERLVDRLLASPHYGERWGRHWLDLVRYSETLGHEFDYDLFNAWQYRDYVIRAINADVPFDQFAMEHVAGDLLEKPRRNPADGSNESVVGTAFWWMGEGVHSPVDVRQAQADRMDNQIDVFGKAFLGQTLACARCHDHKFDPITQKDYYGLAGYLRSSRYQQAYLDAPERISAKGSKLSALRDTARPKFWEAADSEKSLARYLSAAAKLSGAESPSSPILAGIAKENGLEAVRLANWATLLHSDEAARPEHPLFALFRLARPERMPFRERAAALHEELVRRDAELVRAEAATSLFEDFNGKDFEGWRASGDAFGAGPTGPGTLRQDGGKLTPVPAGLAHSGLSSDRLEGVLRSRSFTIEHNFVLVRAAGRDSRINVVLDGFQLIREPIYGPCQIELNDDRMAWRAMDMSMWKGHRAYIELVDSAIPTLSHGEPGTFASKLSKGYIAVDEIRFSDSPAPPPARVDPANFAALEVVPPDSLDSLAARYQDLFHRACCSLGDNAAAERKLDGLAVCVGSNAPPAELPAGYAAIESAIPPPTCAPALADGPGEDEDVFLRGSYKTPGEKAPRALVKVCAPHQPKAPTDSSGRLELARRLVSRDNPLFARVIVNRVWLHHFGEGIVRSPDDFGHMGQRPSHPDLLDWLAAVFSSREGRSDSAKTSYKAHKTYKSYASNLALGYSLKALHRLIVTSGAYRMSSNADVRAKQLDPQNRLLSHMPVRRLEAEAIRDSILAMSGRLDMKMYGRSVLPYLTPFMEGRGKPPSGPLDGDGRRSIYISVRRNFLTPMFLAFDYPIPFSCIGRRSVSNVPSQALTLMNGPFVLQQSKRWAERLLADQSLRSSAERIQSLYLTAFTRLPATPELVDAQKFLTDQAGRYHCSLADPRVWADLCHVLINVKEFIFVR